MTDNTTNTGAGTGAEDFDIRQYTRTAAGSHEATLPLAAFAEHPLAAQTLRAIAYLRDLERFTMHHMRDVLVTPSHKDARLTAFLATWAFEKYWIADAFDRILAVHDNFIPATNRARLKVVRFGREFVDRVSPIFTAVRSNLIGEDFISVHVTRGYIDELVSRVSYAEILKKDPNAALVEVLQGFQLLRNRHLQFFEGETLRRLEESAQARKLTRSSLRRSWAPTGTSEQPIQETRFMMNHLFSGPDGSADIAGIDGAVDALPGLRGLHIMRRAARRFGVQVTAAAGATRATA
ncbi:ferritin-like domain-containing protein [soil metagenome]